MSKWAVTIMSGKALRDAIYNDDTEKCYECLKDCYQELHDALPDEFTDVDLDMRLADIEEQLEIFHNLDDYDVDKEECEEEFNYLLDDFYDLCDDLRVWVGM